jgi:hypothetical protein
MNLIGTKQKSVKAFKKSHPKIWQKVKWGDILRELNSFSYIPAKCDKR